MDLGNVTKPVAPAPVAAAQRPDPAAAARPVAPADLDPDRSVAQVASEDAVRLELSPGARERGSAMEELMRRIVKKSVEVDEATRSVVTRSIDQKTGEVVDQVPAEQILKLRAYFRGVEPR